MITRRYADEPRIPAALPVEPEPVIECALADLLDQREQTITALAFSSGRIREAAQAYRDGKPGLAEYHLVRAGLAIARAIDDVETADTLAELRLVKVPGADS